MRKFLICFVLLVPCLLFAQDDVSKPADVEDAPLTVVAQTEGSATIFPTTPDPKPVVQPVVADGEKVTATQAANRDRFFSRNWRKLGLTARNGARILSELQSTGEISESDPRRTKAAAIAAVLAEENPEAYAAACKSSDMGDWQDFFDALVTFIEKLIPLIQMLIKIFGI